MESRVSLITLGVASVPRARAFYEALGWRPGGGDGEEIVFFQAGSMILSLWDRASLAADSGALDAGGWGGITLAHNVRSTQDVDDLISDARAAGGRVTREPAATFWGGYSGVFVDPDGHHWEVAHNPGWPIDDDGAIRLG